MTETFGREIQKIGIESELYPEALKKISEPPETLYFSGKLLPASQAGGPASAADLPDEKCFAIVGTRRASDYGKEIAFSFAKDLAQAGLVIISGMARGIDTFAHKGALEAGGRTIAVLGTGLDEKTIYPQENLKLAKKILENNGCLISEYAPEYPGSKYTFPQRNRIISALSLGVLVVEAKFGSGALITADYAKKQGKKLLAAPGNIFSLNSKGPHELIKKGAILVEKPSDVLKALNIPTKSLLVFNTNRPKNQAEKLIIDILSEGNSDIDKIIEKTNLPCSKISSCLSLMEIEGKIKNIGANVYALTR